MARSNQGLKKPKLGKGLKSEPLHRRLTLSLHSLCPLNAALSHKSHRGHTGHTAHRAHTAHIAHIGHTGHTAHTVHADQQDTQGTAEEMTCWCSLSEYRVGFPGYPGKFHHGVWGCRL